MPKRKYSKRRSEMTPEEQRALDAHNMEILNKLYYEIAGGDPDDPDYHGYTGDPDHHGESAFGNNPIFGHGSGSDLDSEAHFDSKNLEPDNEMPAL